MARPEEDIADLTRGTYRRQYAGFIGGKRINQLSLEAEAWFWRVHAAADDFGNVPADMTLLYGMTAGRRLEQVPIEKVGTLVREIVAAKLLLEYSAEGDRFYHVVGWMTLQPAGRNGKRARRMPASPWENGSDDTVIAGADARDHCGASKQPSGKHLIEKGESRCIQDDPSESRCHHHQDQDQDQNQSAPAAQAAAEIGQADSSASTPPAESDKTVRVFPCDGKPQNWALKASLVKEFAELFPALDAMAECSAAYAYVLGNPRNKKTASGMRSFLTKWLTRSQNNPRLRAKSAEEPSAHGQSARPGVQPSGVKARALQVLERTP